MQTSQLDRIMDVTDAYCRTHSERLLHAQVFDHARNVVIAKLNQADSICENDLRHYTCAQSLKILKKRRDVRRKSSRLISVMRRKSLTADAAGKSDCET